MKEADQMAEVLGPIGELAAHALTYAETGLDVFPVNPHDKAPLISQYKATTDFEQIDRWWHDWPTALIGHRLPADQIILDIDPRHGGRDVWMALREHVGDAMPVTRYHASGRGDGGGHLWWLRPDINLSTVRLDAWAQERSLGHAVTNRAGDPIRWSAGIDILQHTHRYTILPPSPHPDTGKPYQWVEGRGLTVDPAPLPAFIADLISDAPAPPKPAPSPPDPSSIADWYSATTRWSQLLPRHGWHVVAGDGDTDGSRWKHPSATTAVSATIRHGCLFVYSTSTEFEPTEPGNARGYTPFRAYTLLEHGGDGQAAARAARELKDGAPTRDDLSWAVPATPADAATGEILDDQERAGLAPGWSWRRTNIADLVTQITAGHIERPTPTIGRYTAGDGALWYRGRVNGLYGEPGKGKTMLAVAVATQVLNDGGTVAWIDIEEPAHGIVQRLLDLGATPDAIAQRFAHYAPEEPIRNALTLADELADLEPAFVVVDSTGEALALEGAKPNNDDEVANWFRTWPRRIANHTGAAVTVIDHVVKDETTRGLWPGGSQRKKAAINGAAFMLTPITELGRGVDGRLKITTSKDRSGFHRTGRKAAEFALNADGTWNLDGEDENGDGTVRRPTFLMDRVSRYLELEPHPLSGRAIEKNVRGKGVFIRRALESLVAEEFVAAVDGGFVSVRPFRDHDERSELDAEEIADLLDGEVLEQEQW